jgi:hypothetical protein
VLYEHTHMYYTYYTQERRHHLTMQTKASQPFFDRCEKSIPCVCASVSVGCNTYLWVYRYTIRNYGRKVFMVIAVLGREIICTATFSEPLTHNATNQTHLNGTAVELVAIKKTIVPAGYSCQSDKIEGYWSHSWKWINKGCQHQLTLKESMLYLSTYMEGKIVFIGDSQMRSLRASFQSLYPNGNCKEDSKQRAGRCGIVKKYFRLKEPSVWVPPNHTLLEGPISHGLQNPDCNDMRSTWGVHRCKAPATGSAAALEFLGVEYARDVEMQNALFNTTQDSAIHCLRRSADRASAIVVNTGIHDALLVSSQLCPDLETRIFSRETPIFSISDFRFSIFSIHTKQFITK